MRDIAFIALGNYENGGSSGIVNPRTRPSTLAPIQAAPAATNRPTQWELPMTPVTRPAALLETVALLSCSTRNQRIALIVSSMGSGRYAGNGCEPLSIQFESARNVLSVPWRIAVWRTLARDLSAQGNRMSSCEVDLWRFQSPCTVYSTFERGKTMSKNEGAADRVWALVDAIKVAMVVTHDSRGDDLRARPMAGHVAREENAIYFLTDAGSGKVGEVKDDGNVCLVFVDTKNQNYVSMTGRAELSNDRVRIAQFWSISDKAFWSDKNDPAIRLLRVEPHEAEYWQGSGALVSVVKMFLARLAVGKPNLHGNKKVMLSGPPDS